MLVWRFVLTIISVSTVLGCSQQSSQSLLGFTPNQKAQGTPAPVDPSLKICSTLNLKEIEWPKSIPNSQWNTYFALALNITGSFEGREGWQNISNNFDGQGLSLGLMQQNFGQGSLQPLIIELFQKNNSVLVNTFTTADSASLKFMLEKWSNSNLTISVAAFETRDPELDELFPNRDAINELDLNYPQVSAMLTSQNSASVEWAVNTIYSGTTLIPRWKKSFQDMASSAAYRSLQVNASTAMFLKAKAYFDTLGFKQLRSLLFLYDIVVQNGSLNSTHLAEFKTWTAKNPQASEQDRTLALLEIRLKSVNPVYVEDVRARKSSIIYGAGIVHKTKRNYANEYCFNPMMAVE